jgi:hypothetical protein
MSQTNEETQTQNAAPQPQLTENEQKERAALQGLLNEAVNYAARHSALTIGRLETHYEGVAEEKVPIQAKFKESSFLVMRDGPAKELRAGTHKVGELVTVAGVDHGKQSDRQHRFACICSIPKASFTAPVMFPDLFDIFAQADIPLDLSTTDYKKLIEQAKVKRADIFFSSIARAEQLASMRSSDNYQGSVRLQLEFRVVDAALFVQALQDSRADTVGSQQEQFEQTFADRLAGKSGQPGAEPPTPEPPSPPAPPAGGVLAGGLLGATIGKIAQAVRGSDEVQSGPTVKVSRGGPFGFVLDALKGKREGINAKLLEPKQPITFAHLYQMLRFELTRVVANGVRQYTVEDLYDNPERKEHLQRDIQQSLNGATLSRIGLELTRVVALQFVSEAYQRRVNAKQALSENQDRLEALRQDAGLLKDFSNIETDRDKALNANKRLLELDGIKGAAEIEDVRQDADMLLKAKREAAAREQERLAKSAARERDRLDQEAALAAQRGELTFAAEAFEHFKNAKRFEHEMESLRRREQAELQAASRRELAAIDVEKLLPILMAENPALQQAFVAAKNAENANDRFAAERQIRDEMTAMHQTHGANLQALMLEAAKQVGHVTGKMVEGKKEQRDALVVTRVDTSDADRDAGQR